MAKQWYTPYYAENQGIEGIEGIDFEIISADFQNYFPSTTETVENKYRTRKITDTEDFYNAILDMSGDGISEDGTSVSQYPYAEQIKRILVDPKIKEVVENMINTAKDMGYPCVAGYTATGGFTLGIMPPEMTLYNSAASDKVVAKTFNPENLSSSYKKWQTNLTHVQSITKPDTPTPDQPDQPTPDQPTPDKPTPDKPTPDKPDQPAPDKWTLPRLYDITGKTYGTVQVDNGFAIALKSDNQNGNYFQFYQLSDSSRPGFLEWTSPLYIAVSETSYSFPMYLTNDEMLPLSVTNAYFGAVDWGDVKQIFYIDGSTPLLGFGIVDKDGQRKMFTTPIG